MDLQSHDPELYAVLVIQARLESWRRGDLRYKLHDGQLELYDIIRQANSSRYVLEIARRWGKTWFLSCLAIEKCLSGPNKRVVYGAPSLKHLIEFVIPTIEEIAEDAPPECRPRYNSQRGHFEFPNGSHIHLFGAETKRHANRGRGAAAHLVIFDEAGFTPVLSYTLRIVLRPQLQHTGGMTILGSTPAEEPDHDFTKIAEIAEANGHYQHRTIYDNPLLSAERIKQYIEEDARDSGLPVAEYIQTDDFRREHLAERVVNKLLVVVPEWEEARKTCLRAWDRPLHFDALSSYDWGGADPHAVLFGYQDFKEAKLIIEDEIFLKGGENTAQLAAAVKAKEVALWGERKYDGTLQAAFSEDEAILERMPEWMRNKVHDEAPKQPYLRVGDTNIQAIRDFYELHGIAIVPTQKDQKHLAVNNLRVMVGANRLLVHPRCGHLDRHLRTTTWKNEKRRDFQRRSGEHGDALDSLLYMSRNIPTRNPYPTFKQGKLQDESQAIADVFLGNTPFGRRMMK